METDKDGQLHEHWFVFFKVLDTTSMITTENQHFAHKRICKEITYSFFLK